MNVLLDATCAALGLVTFAFWLYRIVTGPRTLPVIALAVYMGASTVSFVVLLPMVYSGIGTRTHVVNLAGAVSGVCVLVLLGAQQVLLMYWTHPPNRARSPTRLRLLLIGSAIVGYIGTFAAQLPATQYTHFYLHYSRYPDRAPYLVIYIVACTAGETDVLRASLRYVRIARRRWMSRGMAVTAVGAACILVYCAIRISDLACGLVGVGVRPAEPAAYFFGDIGSALSLVGWVLPAAGPRLSAAGHWIRTRRQLDVLYPLWVGLLHAVPEIALEPPTPRWRDRLRVRGIDFQLYRRVIEIEDCLRALGRPAGLDGPAEPAGSDGSDESDESDGCSEGTWEPRHTAYSADLDRLTSLARTVRRREIVGDLGRRVSASG